MVIKFIKYQIVILSLLTLFLGVRQSEAGKDWSASIRPLAVLRADWEEASRPAYYDGTVYAASVRGEVIAVDAESGRVKWRKRLKGRIPRSLAADDKGVYFGLNDGSFRALAAEDGAERWQLELRSSVVSDPTIDGNTVYFLSGDDTLYAVDASNGEWLWQYQHGLRKSMTILGLPAPVVSEGKVYICLSDGILGVFDSISGKLLWGTKVVKSMRFQDMDTTPAIRGDSIFVASYEGGIFGLKLDGGETIWEVEGGSYKPIFSDDKSVIYTGRDNAIHAVKRANGQELWTAKCPRKGAEPTGVVKFGARLAFGDNFGHIHVIDPETGALVKRFDLWGGLQQTPLAMGNRLFTITGHGIIYVLSLK